MMSAPSLCMKAGGVGHHVHWVPYRVGSVRAFIVSYLSTLSVSSIVFTSTQPSTPFLLPATAPTMIDASIAA